MHFKKAVFILLFLLSTSTLISKVGTDSLFTIEYKATGLTFINYEFIGYSNLLPNYSNRGKGTRIKEESTNYLFDNHSIRIKKQFGNVLLLGTGTCYTKEQILGIHSNMEKIDGDTVWYHSIFGTITYQYIGIPVFVSAKLNYTPSFKAYFEAGINFDFIYSEIHEETKDLKYVTVHSGSAPPVRQTYLIKTYETHPRKDRASFNRITPYLSISFERYLYKNKLSLSVGSVFYFRSFYQEHNTGEYIKNIRFSPLTLGANFHF
ncbi:MAG: hypothetical protein JNL24_00370 [Bacteroidia bacterium]|nr:hypothetical protein [Bacteroidia bacterium]